MQSVTLTAIVDENGHLIVDVPPEIPPGPVEVVIRSVEADGELGQPPQPISREWARAKFIAAGHLNPNAQYAPPDAEALSDKEEEELGRLLATDRPVEVDISEDREERF
jgi:hypothetical protein